MTAGHGPPGHSFDPSEVQRRASDPAVSAWVGASAGAGKTKLLTDRVLRLMLAGTAPDKILCITFTKAAAAEMANRLNLTLSHWAVASDDDLAARLFDLMGEPPALEVQHGARRLFAQVLDAPGGMKIQTIHAFCQSLLRRFPVEANLAPHFEPMDERQAGDLLQQAANARLGAPDDATRAALDRVAREVGESEFADLMAELMRERATVARLLGELGGIECLGAAVRAALDVALDATDDDLVAEGVADSNIDAPGLVAAASALRTGSAEDQNRGARIASWLGDPALRAAEIDTYKDAFLTKEGAIRKRLITAGAAAAHPDARDILTREAERLVILMRRRKSLAVAEATQALFAVGAAIVAEYEAAKQRRQALDYDDLILRSRDLLRRPGVAPWVLFKLDGGIDHILVDEAQDTSPAQWEIIAALAEEFFAGDDSTPEGRSRERTVFAVGDEKQSIFSFQGADPEAFVRMAGHFADRVRASHRTWRPVNLHLSFRSTDAVLRMVDAVFDDPVVRDGVVAGDTPVRHFAYRKGDAGSVELWPSLGPQTIEPDEPWTPPVRQGRAEASEVRLANTLAAAVRGWIDAGEMIPSRGRVILPGDIMILVRRRGRLFVELVRALKEHGVPVAGVDRLVVSDQLVVMDLLALGEFLLLPEDDLTLATVLKTPLIGISEDQLLALASGRSGRLWEALWTRGGRGDDEALVRARDYLADLLARADMVPPYELFADIVERACPADTTSGRRAILRRLGPEAEDALDEFLAQSLAFQDRELPSLQRFTHWMRSSRAEIKRELDQGDPDRVRIMTVHGAKGLQAPVVVLPDTTVKPTQSPRILWPDHDSSDRRRPRDDRIVPLWPPRRDVEDEVCSAARAAANRRRDQEYRRLLYVALTRAEDRLLICGCHGAREVAEDSWHGLCRRAMEALPRVETLVDWSETPVLTHATVQTEPVAEIDYTQRSVGEIPLPSWIHRPPEPEPEPYRPLAPSRPEGSEPAVRSPLAPDDGDRFRRGTLIHTLLELLPELPPDRRAEAAVGFLERPVHCLSPADRDEIVRETLAVIEDPEFAALFGPGSLAEVPVTGLIGGMALAGQIDRLVVTPEAVLVVDYKTHRPPPKSVEAVPAVYLRQMAAYRAALSRIYPDRPVRCALLWTDGPRLMPLDDATIERYAP